MLTKVIVFLLLLFPSIATAMDTDIFQKVIEKINSKDFAFVENFLEENRSQYIKDPEYYVLLLNYSFAKGNQTQLVVAKGEPQKGDIEVKDKESGEVVGFIGERHIQGVELILKGIKETQKAQTNFNNRLDVHFGIIHIAAEIKRWDIVGSQLVKILHTSKVNNNEWEWGAINSMGSDPQKFMIENVQAYVSRLFSVEMEEADNALIEVSETMIKEYPNVIYGYSNLGVLYLANKKYDLAEKYLNQAIAIDPKDEVVKGNLDLLKERRKQ